MISDHAWLETFCLHKKSPAKCSQFVLQCSCTSVQALLRRRQDERLQVELARLATERSELVSITLFLTLSLSRLDADLLVVLLQGREVLTGLGKFALFHSFADVPVHKCTLRVHQVELVIDAGEDLSDSCGVADHAT